MQPLDRGRTGALAGAVGLVIVAVAAAILVAFLVRRPDGGTAAIASSTPSTSASLDASTGPSPSDVPAGSASAVPPTPTVMPSQSRPPICELGDGPLCHFAIQPSPVAVDGADSETVAAVVAAIDGLRGLRSYRYELELGGGRLVDFWRDEFEDVEVVGSATQGPKVSLDARVTTRRPAVFGETAETNETRTLVIDDELWQLPTDAPASPTGRGSALVQQLLLPYGVAHRVIEPFAGAFERAGGEVRDGVPTVHYQVTDAGKRTFASVFVLAGPWTADLWLTADGRTLLEADVHGEPPPGSPVEVRPFHLRIKLHDLDDPSIVVAAPSSG